MCVFFSLSRSSLLPFLLNCSGERERERTRSSSKKWGCCFAITIECYPNPLPPHSTLCAPPLLPPVPCRWRVMRRPCAAIPLVDFSDHLFYSITLCALRLPASSAYASHCMFFSVPVSPRFSVPFSFLCCTCVFLLLYVLLLLLMLQFSLHSCCCFFSFLGFLLSFLLIHFVLCCFR